MPEKHIDQLREILAKGAARDQELQQAMETLAVDLLRELGRGDEPPVWAEIEGVGGERQVSDHFVMDDGWLRGDLVVEVTPEMKLPTSLRMHVTKDRTHEVGLAQEMSYSVIIDPPDEKDRLAARKKLVEHVFGSLEGQVRKIADLPRTAE